MTKTLLFTLRKVGSQQTEGFEQGKDIYHLSFISIRLTVVLRVYLREMKVKAGTPDRKQLQEYSER